MEIEQEYTEKDIYFGSKKNIAYLRKVSGQCYNYKSGDIFFHADLASAQSGLQYRLPQVHLGKQYEKTIVPCIPAYDHYTKFYEFELPQSNTEQRQNNLELLSLKELQSSCFIKVSGNQQYDAIGFKSGKRSAIVKTKEGIYVRLKGCGNLELGFPLEKSVSKYPEAYEPRGCQFNHTAKRELYISDKIDQFLKEVSNESAIKPLGYWLYSSNFESSDSSLKNDAKALRKYSSIYETIGEKRLSTHLLQGLSLLLRGCLRQVKKQDTQYKYIQNLFPELRVIPDNKDLENGIYQVEENMMELLEVEQRAVLLEKETFPLEKENLYANLIEKIPLDKSQQYAQTSINFTLLFDSLNSNVTYKDLFSKISSRLNVLNFNQIAYEIALIYGRIGWELGCIMRSFYKNKLNWGYYSDHDTAFHCNAHPNNFVILPQGGNNLIAPLDFDMAFFEEEFININNDEATYGENDRALFTSYMELSRQSLELALSGLEIMTNFKFETQVHEQEDSDVQSLHSLYIQAFRDTMRIYYMRGFENRECDITKMSIQNKIYDNLHDIIKISLLLSNDEQC